jgi:hypothetical protein
MWRTIGKLDKTAPVNADDADAGAVAFAKAYLKGYRGDHRPGGPTGRDERDAEAFHTVWTGKNVRHGFAGSGTVEFTNGAETFTVERTPNGKTFYGTTHSITRKA